VCQACGAILGISKSVIDHEEYGDLGCNAIESRESPTVWSNILPPYSVSKSKPRKKPAAHSLTLKMEAMCSSKTLDSLQTK
jgi:hypothetical protein